MLANNTLNVIVLMCPTRKGDIVEVLWLHHYSYSLQESLVKLAATPALGTVHAISVTLVTTVLVLTLPLVQNVLLKRPPSPVGPSTERTALRLRI